MAMKFGTSSIIVAAFVGPGTILTCATAGIAFDYALGWVLVFSVAATFVLQSFSAGAGILAHKGVGEAMREAAQRRTTRTLVSVLVVLGLWAGTAAFQTGNLLGATAGVETLTGSPISRSAVLIVISALAAAILALNLRVFTRILTSLVALMSVVFVVAMVLAPVDWGAALSGLLVPTLPEGSLITGLALVGTTVVTYNLFLHASAVKRYWAGTPTRKAWRREMIGMAVFLPLGGFISLAILVAGAAAGASESTVRGIADIAPLIEPAAGSAAHLLFGLGLFAAGITSAVTAPLAAAFGIREIFAWPEDANDWRFRMVWISVLVTGLAFSLTGRNPLEIIVAAQAANGLLLPFMAGFVLLLTARQQAVTLPGLVQGDRCNSRAYRCGTGYPHSLVGLGTAWRLIPGGREPQRCLAISYAHPYWGRSPQAFFRACSRRRIEYCAT